jgi:hypothetical protein
LGYGQGPDGICSSEPSYSGILFPKISHVRQSQRGAARHISHGQRHYCVLPKGTCGHGALGTGQLEFIHVACNAKPKIAATLNFASAYYFINVLGREQRLQWCEMPERNFFSPQEDGTELFGLLPDFHKWKVRERAPGEPLIWRDTPLAGR